MDVVAESEHVVETNEKIKNSIDFFLSVTLIFYKRTNDTNQMSNKA